ncbi:hypothetical protein [Bartonella queenslandensis]|uniref:hypothetical protein n=1 Tax=Bartonella queenslandensis TaxID=481138 RepID=UPI00030BF88D|nr:hypothetical protein [Bartonella queenslandensis]
MAADEQKTQTTSEMLLTSYLKTKIIQHWERINNKMVSACSFLNKEANAQQPEHNTLSIKRFLPFIAILQERTALYHK